jgi:hypothetical protein
MAARRAGAGGQVRAYKFLCGGEEPALERLGSERAHRQDGSFFLQRRHYRQLDRPVLELVRPRLQNRTSRGPCDASSCVSHLHFLFVCLCNFVNAFCGFLFFLF